MSTELLPFAIGIVLSPFPVLPLIVLLGTTRPLLQAGAYLAGWAVSLLVVVIIFELIGEVLERPEVAPGWLVAAKAAVGVALIALGLRQWLQGRSGSGEPPGWLASLTEATAVGAARFGVTMAAGNPKIVVFAAGAGVAIGSASLTPVGVVWWSLVMVGMSSVVLLALYLARVVLGERVAPALGQLNDWLIRHGKTLTAAVLVILGVLVLVKAGSGLG